MGEASKRIGEYGEDLVEVFLAIIGWKNLQRGVDIPCVLNEKHLNVKGNPRQSHGIDFIYSYKNPLISGILNNVLISSKFTSEKYPNNPIPKFKEYFDDLAEGIECFTLSEKRKNITQGFSNYTKVCDIGLLFWLNNNPSSDDDLISNIANARIKDNYNINSIYIIDNRRILFLLDLIKFIRAEYANYDFSFFYPNTGQNICPIERENTGHYLPIEYINSSLIPIKIQNKDNAKEIYFSLFCIDSFEKNDFLRIMGISKDLSTNMASKVIICFPDYNKLLHANDVAEVIHQFQDSDFSSTVSVKNFRNQFPNI